MYLHMACSVLCFSSIILFVGATAFRNAFFGQGTGRILLDNVQCTGSEIKLVNCPHNGIGIENCVHAEDAGVRCAGRATIQVYKCRHSLLALLSSTLC